ncbi:hypothetical protein ACHAWT_001879 [Skeletonema menzelii]
MNNQSNQKTTSPGDFKDLKALYAQSFALVTPANKDADENNPHVPIKKEEDACSANDTAKPDHSVIKSSIAKIEQNSSPVSQITHMDAQAYPFDNIDPLPYDQNEQIALHGSLGNHFLDMMNSPVEPPSIGNEVHDCLMFHANDLEADIAQMPNLPEVEVMGAAHHPLPFYPPPNRPIYQGHLPYPQYVYCNYGYAHPDDHSADSTPILHPKAPTNQSSATYDRRRRISKPQITPGDDQEFIPKATENDVICGRGGAINNHPGNRRFRSYINELKYQYLHEPKQTKPEVAMRVLALIKQSDPPGRFLMKFPQGYLECSMDRAKEKASQALREGAAKLRKEGYGDKKKETGPLVVKPILLLNESASGARRLGYEDDEKYCDQFEPPRPRKKSRRSV